MIYNQFKSVLNPKVRKTCTSDKNFLRPNIMTARPRPGL